jgi:hypothetical protein
MKYIVMNSDLNGNRENWDFFGDGNGDAPWTQDQTGNIYPPIWSNPDFDTGVGNIPNIGAHHIAKEDYAFLISQCFEDVDVSVKYKWTYSSVAHGGIIFRAVNNREFYVIDIFDMERKGNQHEIILSVQDGSGYRREIARGMADHSVVPDRIYQLGPKNLDEWYMSSADWINVRVQATGTFIRVSADDKVIFDVRDCTYLTGFTGLIARGAVFFREFNVSGGHTENVNKWSKQAGEFPAYFLPGGTQPVGFNVFPTAYYTKDETVIAAWVHAPDSDYGRYIVFTSSADEGKTWTIPEKIHDIGYPGRKYCTVISLFEHKNGDYSCIINIYDSLEKTKRICILVSADKGKTWHEDNEFMDIWKQLTDCTYLYSPMFRISDGRVAITGYEAKTIPGGNIDDNSMRIDRSYIFFSSDDGHTWDEPIYYDPNNLDSNENMVAEIEPGRMIAFTRTLRSSYMWTASSEDGGKTWTSMRQSNVTGECPWIFRHSTGAIIMFNRGFGSFIRVSYDNCKNWTPQFRISPASAMIGMTEMKNGKILILMHEGYKIPGVIRGQIFSLNSSGPVAEI